MNALSRINQFSFEYYQQNISRLTKKNSPQSLLTDKELLKDIWEKWIRSEKIATTSPLAYSSVEKQFLTERILATIARYKWRSNGYYQILNANDSTLRVAMKLINQ